MISLKRKQRNIQKTNNVSRNNQCSFSLNVRMSLFGPGTKEAWFTMLLFAL